MHGRTQSYTDSVTLDLGMRPETPVAWPAIEELELATNDQTVVEKRLPYRERQYMKTRRSS